MPVGLVSDTLLQLELSRLSPQSGSTRAPVNQIDERVPSPVHTPELVEESHPPSIPQSRGRSEGDVNIPESLRKLIGEESVINGRSAALQLAKDFGVSASSVSAYAKGATSTASYNTPKPGIIQHINKSRRRAIKKAGAVLNDAMAAITQDKLDYTDARDLSSIAKDMSVIIKNLEPPAESAQSDKAQNAPPQFVIYAPTFRDERSFDSITVQE
jgi:hypothetical protein